MVGFVVFFAVVVAWVLAVRVDTGDGGDCGIVVSCRLALPLFACWWVVVSLRFVFLLILDCSKCGYVSVFCRWLLLI